MQQELNFSLILASSSPRRKELLEHAGFTFQVIVNPILEKKRPNETIIEYTTRNSNEKALAVSLGQTKNDIILSADTIVVAPNGELLEKPVDEKDAFRMLKLLSGNTHLVYTVYSLYCLDKKHAGQCVETQVTFRRLSDDEILKYIETKDPFDKSGAYGIQKIGLRFVDHIHGSYTSVMGLPVSQVTTDLFEINKYFKK